MHARSSLIRRGISTRTQPPFRATSRATRARSTAHGRLRPHRQPTRPATPRTARYRSAPRHVAAQFNNDRRAATRAAMRELQQQLPIGNRRRYRRSEWQALERWSLVLVQIPDLARWPAAAKRDLVALVKAKGQTSELPYLRQLQRHPRLIRALAKLG